MRILLATSSFKGGGISSYAHELIKAYSKENQLAVIVGDDSYAPIQYDHVVVYRYSCEDLSINNAIKVLSLITDLRPDVIINSNAMLISLLAPYIPASIRLISVAHSMKFREVAIACFNGKYVDNVIALSHYCKQYITRKYKISKSLVSVVYNFVSNIPNQQEILENKVNNQTVNIVYSGGGSPSKSPELVIEVIDELIKTNLDFRFYWLGSVTPPLKKIQLFSSFSDLIRPDCRVQFIGKVPRQVAEEIIAKSNIFFAPSRREGCPMALLEAMRAGTISVVADYNIANKEIITHNYDGFIVDHNDIPAFVKLFKTIISDHNKLSYIYVNSVNTFNEKLSFRAWKQKMDSIIYIKNDSTRRKRGIKEFNINFRWQRFILNAKMFYNKYSLIFSEYLPCAWSVSMRYLKIRISKLIKKNEYDTV